MRLEWFLAPLLLAACSSEPEEVRLEMGPYLASRLAALEAEIPKLPDLGALDPERERDYLDWVRLACDPSELPAVQEEVRREGERPGTFFLASLLIDTKLTTEERCAAANLLGSMEGHHAGGLLVLGLGANDPKVRAASAQAIGRLGEDAGLLDLLRRLEYEEDHDAWMEAAAACVRFDNYSGLSGVLAVQSARSAEIQAAVKERTGREPEEVARLWNSIDAPQVAAPERSSHLRLQVLESLDGALAPEPLAHFGPWLAEELAPLLFDENLQVRARALQALLALGPRAQPAGPDLVHALRMPDMASLAAEAIGRAGYPDGGEALEAVTGSGHPMELRLAAVTALGRLGVPDHQPAVTRLFEEEDVPLKLEAAIALVLLRDGDRVAEWLHDQLEGEYAARAEEGLGTWIYQGMSSGRAGFDEAWTKWQEAGVAPPGHPGDSEPFRGLRRSRRQDGVNPAALLNP